MTMRVFGEGRFDGAQGSSKGRGVVGCRSGFHARPMTARDDRPTRNAPTTKSALAFLGLLDNNDNTRRNKVRVGVTGSDEQQSLHMQVR